MFNKINAFSSFSVNDIEKAKNFYGNTLALDITKDDMGILVLEIGNSGKVIIYPKGEEHFPANFTILNFPVKDIEKAVDELTSKGVKFEQYSGEMQTDEKGIFRKGGPLIAWFKDPSGNILSVIEEK